MNNFDYHAFLYAVSTQVLVTLVTDALEKLLN